MVKDIIQYPNQILREKSSSVISFDKELQSLISDLTDTVKINRGAGLAAVQIGVLKRVFVSYVNGRLGVFINPNIVEYKGKQRKVKEGCLSLPNVFEEVKRYPHVVIEYANATGFACILDTENDVKDTEDNKQLLAQVLQHEYSHLNGGFFLDSFTPTKRSFILKKLKNKK